VLWGIGVETASAATARSKRIAAHSRPRALRIREDSVKPEVGLEPTASALQELRSTN
jgi:hypothetical protein